MTYTINVERSADKGRLTFKHGSVAVDTTCWWDKDVKVDPGEYTSYATRMATKTDGHDGGKREAIWLGPSVPVNNNARKAKGIFIHKGTGPSWSDGCIIIVESELIKIWQAITPKEQANVKVIVTDKTKSTQPTVEPSPWQYTLPFGCHYF
ncbi:MAG: hypothetical protein R3202_11100 [Candidatus Competibacterales bacterium]|nr:hypothetical protein [Candidatus Competibacterales bacterium]